MDGQDPSTPVVLPYRSPYRPVQWIGEKHVAHPSFGPAIFTAAALWFLIQIVAALGVSSELQLGLQHD